MFKPNTKVGDFLLKILAFVAFLTVAYRLAILVSESGRVQAIVQDFGLLGIFIVSVVSGFNIIVPIPIATFIPAFVEAGFSFLVIVTTISAGMTVGDLLSYWIGVAGRNIVVNDSDLKNHWFVRTISKAQEKYKYYPYFLLFFFVSFVPLPNEITVMPMGFLGYKMRIIIPILVVGNFIFNIWAGQAISRIFGI